MSYQPRYLAYARVHGCDPATMMERDRARYPGGVMAGYMVWVQARLREWRDATGYHGPMQAAHHGAFDAWLKALPVLSEQPELFEEAA